MPKDIEKDLRSWSREVLEVPNESLKGLSPCPYAKNAWEKDKVLVVETDHIYADSLKHCAEFTVTGKELVVIASYNTPKLSKFHRYVQNLNVLFDNLHCMDWESSIDRPYCMVFIQDLAQVVYASDKLQCLGYYDVYPKDEYEELVVNRKRRLKNGYETSCYEEEASSDETRRCS